MKKRFFSLILTAVMLFSILPAIPAYAADKLVCDYDRDGDLYSFYVKDSSGNSVFTVDLEPAQASEESFYIFNPTALGLKLSVSVEYGLEEIGNGAPCPIVRFSNALPGCCGLAVYVLLSEGSRETYEAALLCETKGSTPALVYSDALSRTKQDKLLLVNAVSGELYNRKEAEITQVNAFVIASDYTDASAGLNDCKVEEVNLDSLTLYFKTGEQACECLSSLVAELGLPEKQEADYYYTENGVDYWYIPQGKTRSDAICVSPQESGYYAVDTYACGSNFFHGDVSTDLVAGDSSVFYMAFAEPVSECMGIVSSAKLTMIGLEAMSKYIWGIGVKETPTQKWFFMDYFDYVSAAKSGDWTTAGILFPSAMQIDGFIVCPMEYFDENFVMQYPGRATLLFADGRAAMRFMRQLESYPREQPAASSFTSDDLLNMEAFRYTYHYLLPTLVEALSAKEDWEAGKRYMAIDDKPLTDETSGTVSYSNSAGDLSIIGWYGGDVKTDAVRQAQALGIYSPKDFFPLVSSFVSSFISACCDDADYAKLENWMNGLSDTQEVFQFGDYAITYAYYAEADIFCYILLKNDKGQTPENESPEASATSGTLTPEDKHYDTLLTAGVGDIVTFGAYEQDNDAADGKEAIEWLVLDKKNDRLLLVSKYALDGKPYHTNDSFVTWENCSLRAWLNESFLSEAFDAEEQVAILTADVDNSRAQGNPDWSTPGGNNTQDKVFLLSYAEAMKYFKDDDARMCMPTAYTASHYAPIKKEDGKWSGNCWWWLRSPGENQTGSPADVTVAGTIYSNMGFINAVCGLRPVFWLDTSLLKKPEKVETEKAEAKNEETVSATSVPKTNIWECFEETPELSTALCSYLGVKKGAALRADQLSKASRIVIFEGDICFEDADVEYDDKSPGKPEKKLRAQKLQLIVDALKKAEIPIRSFVVCGIEVESLDALKDLPLLRELIAERTGLTRLSFLTDLDSLKQLSLKWNGIKDISALSSLTGLEWLNLGLNDIVDISALDDLTELRYLNLSGNDIVDLSPLSGLNDLQFLFLSGNKIKSISTLSGLINLLDLDLSRNEITDVSALRRLERLEELSLGSNKIQDISALSGLQHLRKLSMYANEITSISSLADMRELLELSVSNNRLSDISPLKELRALTSVSLYENSIQDLSALADLIKLEVLNLKGNAVRDILPLAELKHLKGLNLSDNQITDFSVLSGLTKLEKLYISGNNISSLSQIASAVALMPSLEYLGLDNNSIYSAEPLAALTSLKEVSLNGNRITSLSPFTYMTGLKKLHLDENGISSLGSLSGLNALEYLSLEKNSISDVRPLAILKNLETLYLEYNEILDVSALSSLKKLKTVDLGSNHIYDFSPIENSGLTIYGMYSQIYVELSVGSTGELVRRLQERLIDLGYLGGSVDGQFGSKTAAAVKEFCEGNNLTPIETATEDVQKNLFSSSAKGYTDPYMPLAFKDNAYGQWNFLNGDKLQIRVEVTNISKRTTVKAFEMYMYAEDVWGNKIYDDSVYYDTTNTIVNPGCTVYCDYMTIPYRSRIDTVYVGIHKVILSDGSVRENYPVDYWSWVIR